jgi:hypothetical protein
VVRQRKKLHSPQFSAGRILGLECLPKTAPPNAEYSLNVGYLWFSPQSSKVRQRLPTAYDDLSCAKCARNSQEQYPHPCPFIDSESKTYFCLLEGETDDLQQQACNVELPTTAAGLAQTVVLFRFFSCGKQRSASSTPLTSACMTFIFANLTQADKAEGYLRNSFNTLRTLATLWHQFLAEPNIRQDTTKGHSNPSYLTPPRRTNAVPRTSSVDFLHRLSLILPHQERQKKRKYLSKEAPRADP